MTEKEKKDQLDGLFAENRELLLSQARFYNKRIPEIGTTAEEVLNEYYKFVFENFLVKVNEIDQFQIISYMAFFVSDKTKTIQINETQQNAYLLKLRSNELNIEPQLILMSESLKPLEKVLNKKSFSIICFFIIGFTSSDICEILEEREDKIYEMANIVLPIFLTQFYKKNSYLKFKYNMDDEVDLQKYSLRQSFMQVAHHGSNYLTQQNLWEEGISSVELDLMIKLSKSLDDQMLELKQINKSLLDMESFLNSKFLAN